MKTELVNREAPPAAEGKRRRRYGTALALALVLGGGSLSLILSQGQPLVHTLNPRESSDGELGASRTQKSAERAVAATSGALVASGNARDMRESSKPTTHENSLTNFSVPLFEDLHLQPDATSMTDDAIAVAVERAIAALTAEETAANGAESIVSHLLESMRQDDRFVSAFTDQLEDTALVGAQNAFFLSILGSAGTAAAQTALEEMASGDAYTEEQRNHALLALTHVDQPLPEIVDRLLDRSQRGEVAANLLLSAAALAHRLEEHDAELYERAVEQIHARIATDRDNGGAVIALEALGNLRPATLLPEVAESFRVGNEAERSAALRTTRLASDESSDLFVRRALASDPSQEVRATALEMLFERGQDVGEDTLWSVLKNDDSVKIRGELLRQIHRRRLSEFKALADWAAAHDPSEEIRTLATHLISRDEELEPGASDFDGAEG